MSRVRRGTVGIALALSIAFLSGCRSGSSGGGYSVAVSPAAMTLEVGASATATVTVARHGGFSGDVAIYVDGLGPGASADFLLIPAGQSSGTLTLRATSGATQQLSHASVRGIAAAGVRSTAFDLRVRGLPGTFDPSFGAGGEATVAFGDLVGASSDDTPFALAQAPDGAYLLGATPTYINGGRAAGVARFTRDGALDTTFGQQGRVIVHDMAFTTSVAVLADGRVLVGGWQVSGECFVARLAADGSFDSTFGTAGLATVSFPGGECSAMAVQPDGKIVLGGVSGGWALARLLANGTLDPAFGSGGMVTAPGAMILAGLALQPDGQIVVGGQGVGPGYTPLLARFTADGQVDGSFISFPTGPYPGPFNSIVALPDGGFFAGGSDNNNFFIVRYLADGSVDTSFNSTGEVTGGPYLAGTRLQTIVASSTGVLAVLSLMGGGKEAVLESFDSAGLPDAAFGQSGDGLAIVGLPRQPFLAVADGEGGLLIGGFTDNTIGSPLGGSAASLVRLWR